MNPSRRNRWLNTHVARRGGESPALEGAAEHGLRDLARSKHDVFSRWGSAGKRVSSVGRTKCWKCFNGGRVSASASAKRVSALAQDLTSFRVSTAEMRDSFLDDYIVLTRAALSKKQHSINHTLNRSTPRPATKAHSHPQTYSRSPTMLPLDRSYPKNGQSQPQTPRLQIQ